MKKSIFIFLLFLAGVSFSQINKYGIPIITNYSPEIYEADPQNWAIVSDNRGVMYFANNRTLLEYDGVNWRKISIPNNSIVRSLEVDSTGIVFVGAQNEFGFLQADKTGNLEYLSLSEKLDSTVTNFSDVWKIFCQNNKVYFATLTYVFCYDYEELTTIGKTELETGNFFSFAINNKIYQGSIPKGLLELKTDSFQLAESGDFFINKYIMAMMPFKENTFLIATYGSGLFLYNEINGLLSEEYEIPVHTNTILQEAAIMQAQFSKNYVFSTNEKGIIILDKNLNISNNISTEQGLQDLTSYFCYSSKKDASVWTALNNGISYIETDSPFRILGENQGIEGSIRDIIKFKDTLYIATNLGVFFLDYNENNYPEFKKLQTTQANSTFEAWSFLDFYPKKEEKKLLVGTNIGLFEIEGNKIKHSSFKEVKNDFNIYCLSRSISDSNMIYFGERNSFRKIEYQDKKWINKSKKSNLKFEIRSIVEDINQNIWLATSYNGIIKLTNTNDTIFYDKKSGLPSSSDLYVFLMNKNVVCTTPTGLYEYDENSDNFLNISKLNENCFIGNDIAYKFTTDNKNNLWLSRETGEDEWIEKYIWDNANNIYIKDSISFRRVDYKSIQAIYPDNEGIVWIGTANGIYTYDDNYQKAEKKPTVLLRKITLNEDSIIFFGTFYENYGDKKTPSFFQSENLKYSIDYQYNSIVFEFASPFYESPEKNMYSVYLEGFDNNWKEWKLDTKANYTNIPEGKYTFCVKSKNIYGIESDISKFSFSVKPPWYRTIFAFVFYFILILGIIYITIKLYTKKLKLENERLEKIVTERTAEIRRKNVLLEQSKEEIEAQRDELQIQRDVVMQQKDKIEKQNQDITSSILYASRIQNAILPPFDFTSEFISNIFVLFRPRDIVSGDFYWIRKKENKIIVVAADCTGHGVPGAFMSMLGVSLLNEIVGQDIEISTEIILNKLRGLVMKSLHQTLENSETQDGMDLAMIIIEKETKKVQFTGANNPLLLIRNKNADFSEFQEDENEKKSKFKFLKENEKVTLVELKPDKMPIGVYIKFAPFSSYTFQGIEGDKMYIFSDGIQDQFGGPQGKKFMIKKLKQFLVEINDFSMSKQKEIVNNEIEDWINHTNEKDEKFHQLDDIIIIGVEI